MVKRTTRPAKPRRKARHRNIYAVWVEPQRQWQWRAALRLSGSAHPLTWGKRRRTQEEAAEDADRLRQKHESLPRRVLLTLQQACEDMVQACLDKGGAVITAKGYWSRFKRWFEILQPTASVHEITPEDVRWFIRERRKKHGVTNNGARQDLKILSRVFKIAGLLGESNPVSSVELPTERQPDRPFLLAARVGEIAKEILERDLPESRHHADLVLFVAATGLRAFEIGRCLPKRHIFFDKAGGGVVVVEGKGGRSRRVEFDGDLDDIVRRLSEKVGGGPLMPESTVATILKRWSKRLGEPTLNARVLRRSYATAMDEHVSMRVVQDQLGHSQLATTQKYLGVRPERARSGVAKVTRDLREAGA